jgi:hypothetical protein
MYRQNLGLENLHKRPYLSEFDRKYLYCKNPIRYSAFYTINDGATTQRMAMRQQNFLPANLTKQGPQDLVN